MGSKHRFTIYKDEVRLEKIMEDQETNTAANNNNNNTTECNKHT